jgi:hypothetical protein
MDRALREVLGPIEVLLINKNLITIQEKIIY